MKYQRLIEIQSGTMPRHPRQGQEAEVRLIFDLEKLGKDGFDKLNKINLLFSELGITFDTGSNGKSRDWEWDWSLKGPVKVTFVRFTDDNPENRWRRATQKADPERHKKALKFEKKLIEKIQGQTIMNFTKKLTAKYKIQAAVIKNSPWGRPEDVTKIEEGILWVDTPSHGGFAIKKSIATKRLPKEALKTFVGDWGSGEWVWYEEDQDALIPLSLMDGLFDKAKAKSGFTGTKEKVDQDLIRYHKNLSQYVK